MNMRRSEFVCEVCGRPATALVRDIVWRRAVEDMYYHCEPDGPPHWFCIRHARDSHVREQGPSLDEFAAWAEGL